MGDVTLFGTRRDLAAERDAALRARLDQALNRAIESRSFAQALLADPVLALGDEGCPPHQYLALRAIQAQTLESFAQQVWDCLWGSTRSSSPAVVPALAHAS